MNDDDDEIIVLIWAVACLIGLIATIIVLKGVFMLIFGLGCLGLMMMFLYLAMRHLVLRRGRQ